MLMKIALVVTKKISWLAFKQAAAAEAYKKIYFGIIVTNGRKRKKMSQDGKISSVSI